MDSLGRCRSTHQQHEHRNETQLQAEISHSSLPIGSQLKSEVIVTGDAQCWVAPMPKRNQRQVRLSFGASTRPPQIQWAPSTCEFELVRTSVFHGLDASIHPRVSSACCECGACGRCLCAQRCGEPRHPFPHHPQLGDQRASWTRRVACTAMRGLVNLPSGPFVATASNIPRSHANSFSRPWKLVPMVMPINLLDPTLSRIEVRMQVRTGLMRESGSPARSLRRARNVS